MRSLIIPLLAGMLAATHAIAGDTSDGSLSTQLTYGYASELDASIEGMLELRPALELGLTTQASLVASARVRLDARDKLEPGRPAFDTYAGATRPLGLGTSGSADLRDVYIEFASRRGLTRIGKQQIVWGRLDGIKVLDLLNPQDYREFILDDFAESRISLWSAYFDYSLAGWRAEFAIVPDGTGHAIPDNSAWFELTAPRFRYGAEPGDPEPVVITDRPGHSLNETGAGVRLSRRIASSEIAFVAYSGMDQEPLGRIVNVDGQIALERFFERREALGFSLDMGLGSAVFRVEYAYQPNRSFNTRQTDGLRTVELNHRRAAMGFDFDAPLGLFMNIQYLVDIVANAPPGLVRPDRDRVGTLYLRRAFAYDKMIFEARWYRSFEDNDDLVSLGIEYVLSDRTAIKLAANVFDGPPEGLFGQFAERDRVTFSLSHTF
jgi:hypothetical protein